MYLLSQNASNNSQSQFNNLPSHLVIDICSYLDNNSQFNALISFYQWTSAFESSSKLMDKFKLYLNEEFFKKYRIQDLPDFGVKNVSIINLHYEILRPFYLETLKKYSDSLDNVLLSGYTVNTPNFVKLLEAVQNVTHLELDCVKIDDFDEHPFKLPKLKSLKIIDIYDYDDIYESLHMDQWMTNFKNNQSIEKLHLQASHINDNCWSPDELNSFTSTLPNLKHLIIDYVGFGTPIDANFPVKLETLKISHFEPENAIDFLRTQKETLKDLKISDYTYDMMMELMEDTMQFIFNKMNLKNFECDVDKLIVNYERQPETMLIYTEDSSDDDD